MRGNGIAPEAEVPSGRLGTGGAALLTLAGVAAVENFISIEWSFPYCNRQEDGPASAVFGMPFPYERWSGATSLQYEFVPHLYALNLLVWFCVAWPLVRVLSRLLRGRPLRVTGGVLLTVVVAWKVFVLLERAWEPVRSLAHPPYDAYRELRPVGLAVGRHYQCSPSPFWFGPTSQSSGSPQAGAAQR